MSDSESRLVIALLSLRDLRKSVFFDQICTFPWVYRKMRSSQNSLLLFYPLMMSGHLPCAERAKNCFTFLRAGKKNMCCFFRGGG